MVKWESNKNPFSPGAPRVYQSRSFFALSAVRCKRSQEKEMDCGAAHIVEFLIFF